MVPNRRLDWTSGRARRLLASRSFNFDLHATSPVSLSMADRRNDG